MNKIIVKSAPRKTKVARSKVREIMKELLKDNKTDTGKSTPRKISPRKKTRKAA